MLEKQMGPESFRRVRVLDFCTLCLSDHSRYTARVLIMVINSVLSRQYCAGAVWLPLHQKIA